MGIHLLGVLSLGLLACGGGNTGGPPQLHALYSDYPAEASTNCFAVADPVTVGRGTMSIEIADEPLTASADSLFVGLITEQAFTSSPADCTNAFFTRTVMGSSSVSVDVDAGKYRHVAQCLNANGQSCLFSLTWTATY